MRIRFSSFKDYTRSSLALLALSLLITACTSPAPVANAHHVTKHHKMPVQIVPTEEFIAQLSLTQLLLESNSMGKEALKTHIATLNTYLAHKQKDKLSQAVIILSYTLNNEKNLRHMIAPFLLSQETANFPALQQDLNVLSAGSYTVYDVRSAIVTIAPIDPVKIPDDDTKKAKEIVDSQLDLLLQNKTALTPVEDARVQLHLLQFFMNHHIRDAAYLAADNTRHALANAEDGNGNANTIKALSDQLKAMEDKLHILMPFTVL